MAFATIGTRGIQAQSIDLTTKVTGTLPVPNGGLGLASGTTGQFLKFTGTETLAPAEAGGGKIGQVLNVANGSGSNTTSTSWSDQSNATVNITPSATSSKIYITYNFGGWYVANTSNIGQVKLVRGIGGSFSNIITPAHNSSSTVVQGQVSSGQQGGGASIAYLDSPNTTSTVTYKIQIKTDNAAMNFSCNKNSAHQTNGQYLTVMEVLA